MDLKLNEGLPRWTWITIPKMFNNHVAHGESFEGVHCGNGSNGKRLLSIVVFCKHQRVAAATQHNVRMLPRRSTGSVDYGDVANHDRRLCDGSLDTVRESRLRDDTRPGNQVSLSG